MPEGNVLFIDDDTFLRKVYQAELSGKGYAVSLAADGEEGLQKMMQEKPDLVILDLIMPKKSGFEILADLQRMPELSHIPVLVLSNLAQSEDQQRALDLGAVDYLVKDNTTLDAIAGKIAQYIGKRVSRPIRSAAAEEKKTTQQPVEVTAAAPQARVSPITTTTVPTIRDSAASRGRNFCPQCGFKLKKGAKFCPDCGYTIEV